MTREEVKAKLERFDSFFGDIEPGVFGFFGDFRWLSNFHLSPITFGSKVYPSVEHAYQAAKSKDKNEREAIRLAKTPALAKKMGMEVKLREDWDEIKIDVMEALLRLKFQNPELRQQLINTYPYPLTEDNWWGDTFWGVYQDKGENNLGKLLMKIREDYINQA
jgi:ribA/ribD-fused uncharacterized protein